MAGYEAWRDARAAEGRSTSVTASVPGAPPGRGARSWSSSLRIPGTRARRYASLATWPTIPTCDSVSGTRPAPPRAPSRWHSRRPFDWRGSW